MDKQDQNAMLQGRTHQDNARWSSHIAGKQYYQTNPRDKDQFRTIWVKTKAFTGKPQAHISYWLIWTPPEGIPPIHPLHLQRLMTLQATGDFW